MRASPRRCFFASKFSSIHNHSSSSSSSTTIFSNKNRLLCTKSYVASGSAPQSTTIPKQDLNFLLKRLDNFHEQKKQKVRDTVSTVKSGTEVASTSKNTPDEQSSFSYLHCFIEQTPTNLTRLHGKDELLSLIKEGMFTECFTLLKKLAAERTLSVDLCNLLLHHFCKHNRVRDASFLIKKMSYLYNVLPTWESYNTCLESLSPQESNFGLQLFQKMLHKQMYPSPKAFVKIVKMARLQRDESILLTVWKHLRNVAHSQQVHQYAIVYEEVIHTLTYFGRTGNLQQCLQQMESVGIKKNTSSFNSILDALVLSRGQKQTVVSLLKQMKLENISFNTRTYEIILEYFAVTQDHENLIKYFNDYTSTKNPPSTQLCTILLRHFVETRSSWNQIWDTFQYMKKYNTLMELERFPHILLFAPHINCVNEIAEYQTRRGKLEIFSLLQILNSFRMVQTSTECLQYLVLDAVTGSYHLDSQIVAVWLRTLPPLEETPTKLVQTLISRLRLPENPTNKELLAIPQRVFTEADWVVLLDLIAIFRSYFVSHDGYLSVEKFASISKQ